MHAQNQGQLASVCLQQFSSIFKSTIRRLHRREQHTKFCIDSSKRSCRVDLHVVIAMGYTALYQIAASFCQTQKKKFGVMWAGRQVLRQ